MFPRTKSGIGSPFGLTVSLTSPALIRAANAVYIVGLRKKRYSVVSAPTLADAQRYLAKEGYDLVLADIRLPDGDGTSLLEHMSLLKSPPLFVMITGHGTIESAVSCMRAVRTRVCTSACSCAAIASREPSAGRPAPAHNPTRVRRRRDMRAT